MNDTGPGAAVAKRPQVEIAEAGMRIRSLDEMFRVAEMILRSKLAPSSMNTAEAVCVAIQAGFELGIPIMAAVQNSYVVNGRHSFFGKLVMGQVLGTGLLESLEESFVGEGDKLEAVCAMKRKGGLASTGRFSVAEARTAGLWGKDNWKNYPRDMLMWKARHRALIIFADVLKGIEIAETLDWAAPPEPRQIKSISETIAAHRGSATVASDAVAEALPAAAPAPARSENPDADPPPESEILQPEIDGFAGWGREQLLKEVQGLRLRLTKAQSEDVANAAGIPVGVKPAEVDDQSLARFIAAARGLIDKA